MRLKSMFFGGLAAAVLAGCATSTSDPNVASHYDDITGLRTDVMEPNLLPTREPIRENVWLTAARVFEDFSNFRYYLEARHEALDDPGALNIPSGPTLTLILDGEERVFRGLGSHNSRTSSDDGVTSEVALYEVAEDDLRSIASAEQAYVSLKGESRVYRQRFGADNSARFREFVAAYVDSGDRSGFQSSRFSMPTMGRFAY